MNRSGKKWFLLFLATVVAVGALSMKLRESSEGQGESRKARIQEAVPVEVSQVRHGEIALKRTFSGALEAHAEFVVAPKVGGRIRSLTVNLADAVRPGMVVAELDDEEFVQAVAQARADLEVARANRAEAKSALEVAERDLARAEKLRLQGVTSEVQYDAARAQRQAKAVQLKAAEARVQRAEASLETARIRLGYTKVIADWSGDEGERLVAQRYLDEGETVAANAPLLRIVDLQPIRGVVHVPEVDYARLSPGQPLQLYTDAWPGEPFPGVIERIAPTFRQETRQARVELRVANPQQRLKPGMFIRAEIVLDRHEDASLVPEMALVRRDGQMGVFLLAADRTRVRWQSVRVGIRDGGRVQITTLEEGAPVSGAVVTLGQQQLSDGSAVIVPGGDASR